MKKTKSIFTKAIAMALVMLVAVTSMGAYSGEIDAQNEVVTAAYTEKQIDVDVYLDFAFRQEFSSATSEAQTIFNNAKAPFLSKWNLDLVPTYSNWYLQSDVYAHNCDRPYDEECYQYTCGTSCSNILGNTSHHKNAYQYIAQFEDKTSVSATDIALLMTSYATCYMYEDDDGNLLHSFGPWGLAYRNDEHAMAFADNFMSGYDHAAQQNIQHEISHLFGCKDNVCSSGYKCIMSGGYNGLNTANYDDIWCIIVK